MHTVGSYIGDLSIPYKCSVELLPCIKTACPLLCFSIANCWGQYTGRTTQTDETVIWWTGQYIKWLPGGLRGCDCDVDIDNDDVITTGNIKCSDKDKLSVLYTI